MKTIFKSIILLPTLANLAAASLSDADKQFLAGYEKIHVALAADDLAAAKKAAANLGSEASALAKSNSLEQARTAFADLSAKAEKLAAGQPGYYVAHCPMVNKDWVQTSDKIDNPYLGKKMANCGEIKK